MERSIELAILLAAALPTTRLLARSPVRRELREHPLYAVVVLLGMALSIGVFVALCSTSAAKLRVATLLALGIGAAAALRTRPSWGTGRGLPPGALGLSTSLDAISDEDFYSKAAVRWGPVFKMSQFHQPVVCVVDLKLGFEFIEANADALCQAELPFARLIPGGYLEFMNGESHKHYRELLQPALANALVAARPRIAEVVRQQLATLATDNAAASVDPKACLDRIVFESLTGIFYGVDARDPRFERLRRCYDDLDFRVGLGKHLPRDLGEAYARTAAEVRDLLRDAGSAGGAAGTGARDGTTVAGALARTAARGADDPTLVGNLVFMFQIGRDNLRGFLLWLLKLNADHPKCLGELRALLDSEARGERDAAPAAQLLATSIVSEALRLRQSEYVYRIATRHCRLGGYRVPKGWMVRVCLRECHRREDVFDDASEFQPRRFVANTYDRDVFAPFSRGPHACAATALVMTVAQALVREIAAGFELRTAGDGPIERGNRHWHHWRPNRAFRVAVTARVREHGARDVSSAG